MEEWADVRMRKLKKCASVLCCEKVGETEAMVIERTMLEAASAVCTTDDSNVRALQ